MMINYPLISHFPLLQCSQSVGFIFPFRRTCTQCSGIQTRIMNSFECKRKLKGPQDVTEAHNLLVSPDCRANDDDNYLIIYGLIGVC